MKYLKAAAVILLLVSLLLPGTVFAQGSDNGGKPGGETAGNNLSYPVIWAEGVMKSLPGVPAMEPILSGEWWYWWGMSGTDPNIVPLSCRPDPDWIPQDPPDPNYPYQPCDDGSPGTFDVLKQPGQGWVKAYLQKDSMNMWQAESHQVDTSQSARVNVDLFDWGDNLESVDWYANSQVRTEVVLFENDVEGDEELAYEWPMLEYEMRHVSGWGIDEVHGLAATADGTPIIGPGTQATVYSHCARLTIQKLLVQRENLEALANLEWVPEVGWAEIEGITTDLVKEPIFNEPVYLGGDGPGYYSAEINVKGRIIFGYTWNVRKQHDDTPVPPATTATAAGDYRITFSLDQTCGTVPLNTFFENTKIIVPIEEVVETAVTSEEGDDGGDTGGATGVLIPAEFDAEGNLIGGNYSYIDVRILEGKGGGGGGGGGGPPANDTVSPGKGRGKWTVVASSIADVGSCSCTCQGETCTCDCLEQCKCSCDCVGEECTCGCENNCQCDCACSDGTCDCECMSDDCFQLQMQNREMAQLQNQLQARTQAQSQQCPAEGCVCQDEQGTACQEFQNQFQLTFQEMNQLRTRSLCGGEECSCQCTDSAACAMVQGHLQETIQMEEQLQDLCASGQCTEDETFFSELRTTIVEVAQLISEIGESLNVYLPGVIQPE